jgi:hypothetical protein
MIGKKIKRYSYALPNVIVDLLLTRKKIVGSKRDLLSTPNAVWIFAGGQKDVI